MITKVIIVVYWCWIQVIEVLKETVLNDSFFNYLINYISVIDGNVICLVYTTMKTILFNINYSCTYRNYSPSSDNFYNYLNVIGRLSSLTQRYCSCSCPWPGGQQLAEVGAVVEEAAYLPP